jgi:hypothetical protein
MLIALVMMAFLSPARAQSHVTLSAFQSTIMQIDEDDLTVWGWGGNVKGQLAQVCSSFLLVVNIYRTNAPSLPSCYRCVVVTFGMYAKSLSFSL